MAPALPGSLTTTAPPAGAGASAPARSRQKLMAINASATAAGAGEIQAVLIGGFSNQEEGWDLAGTDRAAAHGIDGAQQVGRDGALEHEGVGAGSHHRIAHALLVVDAEDDHLELGAVASQRPQPVQLVVLSQGEVHDRHVGLEAACAFNQRRLVGHHDHRTERGGEQPAHAFGETVVAVRQQHTTQGLRHQGTFVPPTALAAVPAGTRLRTQVRRSAQRRDLERLRGPAPGNYRARGRCHARQGASCPPSAAE